MPAGAAAALIAAPSLVRAQAATTLRFIPYSDLALLDPLVSAFVTRNHVMMVFDTLYALDAAGVPRPQMVGGESVEDGGRRVRLSSQVFQSLRRRRPLKDYDFRLEGLPAVGI